jgi:uncharacterized protein
VKVVSRSSAAKATLLLVAALCLFGQAEPVRQLHIKTPMRDGIKLDGNLFLPAAGGRFPILLSRTPYGKAPDPTPNYRFFIDRGYGVFVQDVRGRHESEGVFQPFTQESSDGEDTINWLGRQPWCDGNVGMIGGSYVGIAQWRAALTHPPALKAIAPVVAGSDEYRDRFYSPGGAFKLAQRMVWVAENMRGPTYAEPEFTRLMSHLPLRTSDQLAAGHTVGFVQAALDHPLYDEYWRAQSTLENIDRVQAPVMITSGWYDNFAESDLAAFTALRARSRPVRIIIGPWGHNMSATTPETDFGAQSRLPWRQLALAWFDHWMKPNHDLSGSAVQYFTMGVNQWRTAESWPPADVKERAFFLDSGGALALKPSHRNGEDKFIYDPGNPVPTRGGAVCCNPALIPWGPLDQASIESRSDVLGYRSEALKKPLEFTGPVRVVLYVSTSAPDTDFTAKLVDVSPEGKARILCDGLLRLRYRAGVQKVMPYRPGAVEKITIDAGVTSHVFLPGHRVRVDISSSNFPRYDRNPNTGLAVASETRLQHAHQAVFHGRTHGSQLQVMARDVN